jgi:autotransporter-associated beta strand protein
VENTSGTYTLQGTAIGGGASLTKTGAGNLTLLNDNSYTGTTSLSGGGTVTVGTGGTVGTLGGTGNIELSSTTLAFNRSNAQTLDRSVTGTSGTLVKNGTNTLTMSAANNTCDIVINNGTLAARGGGWATSFAANRTITVNAPGILDTTTHALNGLGGGSRPNYIVINEDAIWKLNNEQQLPNISLTLTAGIVNGPGDVRGGGTITTVAHATKSSQINCPVNNGNGGVTFNVADGAVATDLALTGNMGGGNANTKTGPGTLVLSGVENTYSGGTNVNGGTLEVASVADQVLPTDGDDYATGGIGSGYLGIANDATFRYTGTTAETTVRPLWIDTGAQTKTVDIVSATGDVTFSSTAGNINKPFTKTGAGALTLNDEIAPGAAVTVAAGTLTLGGTNTYTGDTTVTGGTLVIDGDSISDDGKLVIDGGVVKVTNNETVQKLFFGAAEQAIGTYGATGSGATNIDDIHFSGTGTGIVTVTGAGYSSWITTFGLAVGDQGAAADPDGDGISNGVEWVLGGNPATGMDTAKLPTVSTTGVNLIFTFKRDQDSKVAGTSVAIEVGTSLAGWPTVYTVGNDTAGSSAGVTVTDNLDGTDTITLTVAQAPDAAKFARLKVSID